MVRAALLSLVAKAFVPAIAVQASFNGPSYHQQAVYPPATTLGDQQEWSFNEVPNPNTTDHLVFDTVYSLLQRWPNMRMYRGHNIVPGTIPKGTLLYHGTDRQELPPEPEWVATDPEHSYLYCYRTQNPQQKCWHVTLATTRPLKVVYFDGGSAAKFQDGTMDTQDLLMYGRTYDDRAIEWYRIRDLCEWGKRFEVDGFVRLEVDFEVMLCDFTSGVRVVSVENLANEWAVQSTTETSLAFESMKAGFWHERFPGETRIQLDLAGLVSFYDTQLAPSLVAVRAGRERWQHRVQGVSKEDLSAAKSRLEAALMRPQGRSSGIDWKTLFQVIVDRFAQRLELTQGFLNSPPTEPGGILGLAKKTQSQLRIMLTPYLPLSVTPPDPSDKNNLNWTIPVYKLCATTHTCSMESEVDLMTDAEKLLLQAVRGISREICRVVTKMWTAGVYMGIDPLLNTKDSVDPIELTQLWNTWSDDLNYLMAWLDWSVWVRCNPECSPEDICYLYPVPLAFVPIAWGSNPDSPSPHHDRPDSEEPTRFHPRISTTRNPTEENQVGVPRPKCIKRPGLY